MGHPDPLYSMLPIEDALRNLANQNKDRVIDVGNKQHNQQRIYATIVSLPEYTAQYVG